MICLTNFISACSDWLDFGDGKFILEMNEIRQNLPYMDEDELCHKKDFNKETVHYFDDEMRREHEVYITPSEDGTELIWRYTVDGELVPESDPDHPHLYMFDLNFTWYMVDDSWDEETYGIVKQTGVTAGRPGLSGGKAYFKENGAIWGINFSSGHYRPEIHNAAAMYQYFKDQSFNLTALHWVGRDSWTSKDCEDTKWHKIEIPGFNTKDLEDSCYEITSSPTWILKEDV